MKTIACRRDRAADVGQPERLGGMRSNGRSTRRIMPQTTLQNQIKTLKGRQGCAAQPSTGTNSGGATQSRTTQAKRQEVRGDTEKLRPLTSQVKAAALRESRAVSEYQECLRKRESHRQLWRTWNQFC